MKSLLPTVLVTTCALLLPGCSSSNVSGNSDADDDGGDVCASDPQAATDTWNPPRRVLPWVLTTSNSDVGTATTDASSAPDAAIADLPAASCTPLDTAEAGPQFGSVQCRGFATVRAIGSELTLELADGSVLRWNPEGITEPVQPPTLRDEDVVFIDYMHAVGVVCPFCGTYSNDELTVRASNDHGPILFLAREGHRLEDISSERVEELFGTTAQADLTCTVTVTDGCKEVARERFDHVLQTTPKQRLSHGQRRTVTTPSGQYDVVWAYGTATERRLDETAGCVQDGPGVASDTGFAASRVNAPSNGS